MQRRLAVELANHGWGAQHAVGAMPPWPVDSGVATAGIGEFLTEFLPGLFAQPGVSGALHLHSAEAPSDWRVSAAPVP